MPCESAVILSAPWSGRFKYHISRVGSWNFLAGRMQDSPKGGESSRIPARP